MRFYASEKAYIGLLCILSSYFSNSLDERAIIDAVER